jgi:hypothetical protein
MDGALRHYREIKNAPSVNIDDSGTWPKASGAQHPLAVNLLQLNRNKLGYSGAPLLQRENDAAA